MYELLVSMAWDIQKALGLGIERWLCGEVDGSDSKSCLTTRKHPR